MSESMNGRRDGQAPARVQSKKLTMGVVGSGELKSKLV